MILLNYIEYLIFSLIILYNYIISINILLFLIQYLDRYSEYDLIL